MRTAIALLSMTLLILFAPRIVAAPGQNTLRPGDPTPARVWVENRGRAEAIPIDVQTVNTDAPIRVQVAGDVAVRAAQALPVKATRLTWEYRTIAIAPGQEVSRVLDPAGAEGWEAIGAPWSGTNGSLVLLKRPR